AVELLAGSCDHHNRPFHDDASALDHDRATVDTGAWDHVELAHPNARSDAQCSGYFDSAAACDLAADVCPVDERDHQRHFERHGAAIAGCAAAERSCQQLV